MITVIIDRSSGDNSIRGIYVSGHSGYAESGSDIVCAGISTLCYTAANALEDICGYDNEEFLTVHESEDDDVNLRIAVPEHGSEQQRQNAQVIMRTAELGMISVASSVNDGQDRFVEIIHSR
ncbi:MAG: ribosomal-processing cysteine protease Prp [Clostridiales bacterium]|nr:ribosomal-processing cysteine protease Prp [Clostridiales bacterium]